MQKSPFLKLHGMWMRRREQNIPVILGFLLYFVPFRVGGMNINFMVTNSLLIFWCHFSRMQRRTTDGRCVFSLFDYFFLFFDIFLLDFIDRSVVDQGDGKLENQDEF